ncbi:MAG TPA: hypothetical protein VF193_07855 [Steroidobacter sp.]
MKLRRNEPSSAVEYRAPGGTLLALAATTLAAGISLFALLEPLTRSAGSIPLEWLLIVGWAAAGACFLLGRERNPAPEWSSQDSKTRATIRRGGSFNPRR